MDQEQTIQEEGFGPLNIAVLFLSIYVLVALLIETFYIIPGEISRLLTYIDNIICAFFFLEFCIRFYNTKNKLKFLRWGWVDLLSSIPMVTFLRAGRILRLIRLLRILRAFRSTQHFISHVFHNRAKGALTIASVLGVLIIIFSSIAILQVEVDPNSNIKTAEDAIWWAYVTITTVGYGDKFPVTTEGRIIGVILMTAGVGLFGTFTAYVASWFTAGQRKTNKE